jgi:hypothetical protein
MRKYLLALAFLLSVSPAIANWTGKNAAGITITFKNSGDCTSVVCVPISQLVDGTGAAFGVAASPLFISFGTGVTLPEFASPPTVNIGAAPILAVNSKPGQFVSAGPGQYGLALSTTSTTRLTVPTGATIAEICVEGQAARYKDDGTAPTTSSGIPAAVGCFQYAAALSEIEFIGQVSGSTLDVSYYK